MTPTLSIVIVNWNTRVLLLQCLQSIASNPPTAQHDIWVVDNGSTDGSADAVATAFPSVRLIRNPLNQGFSAANNSAIRASAGEYVLLLNSDTIVKRRSIDLALEKACQTGDIIACRLLNGDGTLQHSCFRFPTLGVELLEALFLHRVLPAGIRGRVLRGGYWNHASEDIVDWALGAFLVVPRAAFKAVGGLPEEYFIFGEDMEWCFRAASHGFRVHYLPTATVTHFGNKSGELNPPAWRVIRTHRAKREFLNTHYGRTYGWLVMKAHRMGYVLRARAYRRRGNPAAAELYRNLLDTVDGQPDIWR